MRHYQDRYFSMGGKLQFSQSVNPPSLISQNQNIVAAGFSLRVHASWVVPILLALLLTFFTNTDVMGKSTPLRSPLMGDSEGEGVIAGVTKQSPLPSPSMGVESQGKSGGVPEPAKVQVQETYGKLPLYFIQNDGQVDEKVKFYEKGSGHATYFTKEGVYISLARGEKSDDRSKKLEDTSPVIVKDEAPKQSPPQIPSPLAGEGQGGGDKGGMTSQLIKLNFLNANPNPEIIAADPQDGKVNYFIGKDPEKWRTNIPTYRAVVYKEVYPGIVIKFYGNNRQIDNYIII